ncbi:ring finger protein [Gigaspora margarita]|uniref:Ring finger protein n=1 Tax=Gigaspora margarita TaxID=4874 RepID=A0A8H4A962_GIGMA|nr:ring finger protein [Gigaspora margarita]
MSNCIFVKFDYFSEYIFQNNLVKEKLIKLVPIICVLLLLYYILPSLVNVLLVVSILLPIVYTFPIAFGILFLVCLYGPFHVVSILFLANCILVSIIYILERKNNQKGTHYQGEKCEDQLQEEEERKECIICTESVDIIAFLNITDQCNHDYRICRECVGTYIKHELEDNGNIRISYPEDGCNEILDQKDVQKFADEESFKQYERFTLNLALFQITTFQWCLNPNCKSGQDHYQGGKLDKHLNDSFFLANTYYYI